MVACSSGARPALGKFYVRSMTTRNIETLRASIRALSDRATASVLLDVADSAWSWGNNPLPSPVTKATGFRPVATPVQSAGSVAWGDITGKPDTYTPSPHLHQWSDIAGAPDTAVRWPTWDEVTDKPSTFTPSAHTHTKADITDFGAYLPLAGGTMNIDAQVYFNATSGGSWTDSMLLWAGVTYLRRNANDSSYQRTIYLNGDSAQIQSTYAGDYAPRYTEMSYQGFADRKDTSASVGQNVSLGYDLLYFDEHKSAGSTLIKTGIGKGYVFLNEGTASDGYNINDTLRSININANAAPTATFLSKLGTAFGNIFMYRGTQFATNYDEVQVNNQNIQTYRHDFTNSKKYLASIQNSGDFCPTLTLKREVSGVNFEYGVYSGESVQLLNQTYGVNMRASTSSSWVESLISSASTAADFKISNSSTCFIGQDFDIRNNKGLLIGGSSAISSARVGSFAGFSSTGGGTITGGKLTIAPAAAGYASLNIPTRSAAVTSPAAGDIEFDGTIFFMAGSIRIDRKPNTGNQSLNILTNTAGTGGAALYLSSGVDGNLRFTQSYTDSGDTWTLISRNDDGTQRDVAIAIPRALSGTIAFGRPTKSTGRQSAFIARTTAYTVLATDEVIGISGTTIFNVLLPATAVVGTCYTIKRTDSNTTAHTVTAGGTTTIDGATTFTFSTAWQVLRVIATATNAYSVI